MNNYISSFMDHEIKTLSGIESFCYQNCQRILLEAMGVQHSVLFLNASLSFRFRPETGELFLDENIRSLLPSLLGHVSRTYYPKGTNAMEVFEENLSYMAEHNMPIIVGVDSYYLPYASNYQKNHAKHTLLLCGFDAGTELVYVIDWYPNWYYKGTVPLTLFLQARASENEDDGTIYSGKSIENNWAIIEGITNRKPRLLLRELLEVTEKEYYNDSASGRDYLSGPTAIESLAKYVGDIEQGEEFRRIHKPIKVMMKRYDFFRQYLECYDEQGNQEVIKQLIRRLEEESEEWDRVTMLTVKASMSLSTRVKEKIGQCFERIILLESEIKKSIEQLKESIQEDL